MKKTNEINYAFSNTESAEQIYKLYSPHLKESDEIVAYKPYKGGDVIDLANGLEDWLTKSMGRAGTWEEAVMVHLAARPADMLFFMQTNGEAGKIGLKPQDFGDDRVIPDNYTLKDYVGSGKFPQLSEIWSSLNSETFASTKIRPKLIEEFEKRVREKEGDMGSLREEGKENSDRYKSLQSELDILERSVEILSTTPSPTSNEGA